MTLKTILPALLLALFVVGCNIDPNATPIAMFPTKIPQGSLPTYASVDVGGPTSPPSFQTAIQPTLKPTVTFRFVNQGTATPVPPTGLPTLDNNWSVLGNGVQWRRLGFRSSQGGDVSLLVVRADPSAVTLKVKYDFGQTKGIQDWRLALPGALVIVNASYFTQAKTPIGLVAVDGNLMGSSIPRSDSGLFQVKNGAPKVRSTFLEPYNNTERFDQAAQGFPVLMVNGQVAPAFDPDLSSLSARRTIFAQDTQGRMLFIVTPFSAVTLPDLANYLGISGLNINTAVNMDGGASTCMYLATGGPSQFTQGLAPVPVVLAVYPR